MKWVIFFSGLGTLAMSVVLVYGFTTGSFFEDGGQLMQNPWGIVSLVDLYVGFVLFSVWIVYRETTWWVSVLWVALMMVFGFLTASVYLTIHAIKHKDNAKALLLGKHYHTES